MVSGRLDYRPLHEPPKMHSLRPSFHLLAILLIFRCFQTCNTAQCYYPNGDLAEDSPCDPDAEVGPCCGGSLGTSCLNNNLCRGPDGNTIRGSCTDEGWGEGCPLYCTGQSTGGTDLISCSNVTHSDTSYCCDHAQGACCDGGVGRFDVLPSSPITTATWNVARSEFVVIASSTTSSSTTTTSSASTSSTSSSNTISSTTTSSLSSSPTSEPATSSSTASAASTGLSMGEKVGVGVGVGLGVLLFAVLSYAIWLLRKKSQTTRQEHSQESLPGQQSTMAYDYSKWVPPQELSNEPANTNPRYELPVTH
ncbi:hypothetical protein F4818DRAFT_403274 [Hypoxylon cercidicola]|nr:hypothetical protein F4818DRAFT_403274 [Hypoxylon cercidicola]